MDKQVKPMCSLHTFTKKISESEWLVNSLPKSLQKIYVSILSNIDYLRFEPINEKKK